MSTGGGRRGRPSAWEVDLAERLVLAAARQAAEASTRYHYIRTLGGLARWTLMDPMAREDPPPWALRLRAWEGGFYGGGASRLAGIDCLRTSGDYHLAFAHLEAMRALAAATPQERREARGRHEDQLRKTQRSRRRLVSALGGGGRSGRQPG
jgi:hypothetical protein